MDVSATKRYRSDYLQKIRLIMINSMSESYNFSLDISTCPIAKMLDMFGDKWTLLIVRDLILGKKRYGEFAKSEEGIATNILADRLRRLEKFGIVVKTIYSNKPVRYQYQLTNKGKELQPVLESIAVWSNRHIYV